MRNSVSAAVLVWPLVTAATALASDPLPDWDTTVKSLKRCLVQNSPASSGYEHGVSTDAAAHRLTRTVTGTESVREVTYVFARMDVDQLVISPVKSGAGQNHRLTLAGGKGSNCVLVKVTELPRSSDVTPWQYESSSDTVVFTSEEAASEALREFRRAIVIAKDAERHRFFGKATLTAVTTPTPPPVTPQAPPAARVIIPPPRFIVPPPPAQPLTADNPWGVTWAVPGTPVPAQPLPKVVPVQPVPAVPSDADIIKMPTPPALPASPGLLDPKPTADLTRRAQLVGLVADLKLQVAEDARRYDAAAKEVDDINADLRKTADERDAERDQNKKNVIISLQAIRAIQGLDAIKVKADCESRLTSSKNNLAAYEKELTTLDTGGK